MLLTAWPIGGHTSAKPRMPCHMWRCPPACATHTTPAAAEAALEAERREGKAREARHKLTVERLRRQILELQVPDRAGVWGRQGVGEGRVCGRVGCLLGRAGMGAEAGGVASPGLGWGGGVFGGREQFAASMRVVGTGTGRTWAEPATASASASCSGATTSGQGA